MKLNSKIRYLPHYLGIAIALGIIVWTEAYAWQRVADLRRSAAYFVAVALRIFLIRLRTVSLGFAPWPIQ